MDFDIKKLFSFLIILYSFGAHAGGIYSSDSLGFDITLAEEFVIQDGAVKV
jgi:hypothetical protein